MIIHIYIYLLATQGVLARVMSGSTQYFKEFLICIKVKLATVLYCKHVEKITGNQKFEGKYT